MVSQCHNVSHNVTQCDTHVTLVIGVSSRKKHAMTDFQKKSPERCWFKKRFFCLWLTALLSAKGKKRL
jgi:hypothetical protein